MQVLSIQDLYVFVLPDHDPEVLYNNHRQISLYIFEQQLLLLHNHFLEGVLILHHRDTQNNISNLHDVFQGAPSLYEGEHNDLYTMLLKQA